MKHDGLTWYALCVPPQKEAVAKEILHRRGYRAFFPVEQKTLRARNGRRTRKTVIYPMMRGYVFAGFKTPEPPWYDLRNLPITTRIVGVDGATRPIPQAGIDWLQEITSTHVPHTASVSTIKAFSKGDAVEVVTGPLAGHTLHVETIEGDVARVFAKMFGVRRELKITVNALEAA